MDYGLTGQVVLIMGGSSGVGLQTAEMFLAEGAKVVICGRNEKRLHEASSQLAAIATAENLLTILCDVTVESDVKNAVQRTIDQYNRLDVLVNSAGRSVMGYFFDITDEQWEEQIKLKYWAIIYAVRAVYPHMVDQGGGRIININATLSKEPEPHMVATAATSAGLLNLSKTLAHELAPLNILVNAVSLGVMRTNQWECRRLHSKPDMNPEDFYLDLAKERNKPVQRVDETAEVASAILSLASKSSRSTSDF